MGGKNKKTKTDRYYSWLNMNRIKYEQLQKDKDEFQKELMSIDNY